MMSDRDLAGDRLEGRLRSRFATELGRAERDYGELRPRLAAERAGRRHITVSPALGGLLVVLVAVAALAAATGSWRGAAVPAAPTPTPTPTRAAVVLGADGVPTSIDGQHVYRAAESAAIARLTGSFLFGGPLVSAPHSCPAAAQRSGVEALLLPSLCYSFSIDGLALAPRALVVPPGKLVVVRVHAHDPLAGGCGAQTRTACESAFVVEREVWPVESTVFGPDGVPVTIDGQRVYRANEVAGARDLSRGVLVAGRVSVMAPFCPKRTGSGQTTAESDLLGWCRSVGLDGSAQTRALTFAPRGADALYATPESTLIVARVHSHDPEAAGCPSSVRDRCEAAVVIDEIVWWSPPAAP